MMKPWNDLTTLEFADEIGDTILVAIKAHAQHARDPDDMIRKFDEKTPYAIHPIWCAMTILTEAELSPDSGGSDIKRWRGMTFSRTQLSLCPSRSTQGSRVWSRS